MLETTVLWLDQVSAEVFWTCAAGLVLIDLTAMAVVMATRSRELVNRWTGRVLAANLLLLGAGLGVPAAAFTAKLAARAVLPAMSASASTATQSKSAAAEPALPAAAR
ncbi:MAG: hypothetical protein E4H41_05345 [Gemmatimonadales bacterium]|jgi:hypothetical protein|nr:MAG: hypothetical protein E4H41_05345 [Gemmatimonadales bacterium]